MVKNNSGSSKADSKQQPSSTQAKSSAASEKKWISSTIICVKEGKAKFDRLATRTTTEGFKKQKSLIKYEKVVEG